MMEILWTHINLWNKYPYVKPNQTMFDRFPEAIQKALLERKRNELNNTNYTWTSYRDCPFVNKKQVDEYRSNHMAQVGTQRCIKSC